MGDSANHWKGAAGGAAQGAGQGMMMGGPYGAIAGAVIGGVLGYLGTNDAPHGTPYQYAPDAVTRGQTDFLSQREGLPGVSGVLQQANKIDNASFQKDASEFAPNLMGNLKQQAATNAALLAGNLSPGVQAALGKPGATARDLGLTSNQLMLQGAGNLTGELKAATGLNPFNETSMDSLISPAALLERVDARKMYNNKIQNQQEMLQFGASAANNSMASIFSGVGSVLGTMGKTGYNGNLGQPSQYDTYYNPPDNSNYGFGVGDSGPTADSMFASDGSYLGWG